jgi:uncharacterized protein
MNKRLVVFALLLPLATSAQMPIQRVAVPTVAPSRVGGISVAGRGFVRAPVKTVQFVAFAHGPATQDDAIIAAMRAAGIDDPTIGSVGSQLSLQPNAPVGLRGTIRDVSHAKLQKIGMAAADYVRAHPGSSIDSVQFTARIDDCAAIEESARTAALADARRKATAIAAAAGVTLGAVDGVVESGGCAQQFANTLDLGPSQPVDLDSLTTVITVFEQATYSISPADSGRRRPL